MNKVYLAVPSFGGMVHDGTIAAVSRSSKNNVVGKFKTQSFSWLTHNFNMLYAAALNSRREGITHFCMLHYDIMPEDFWIDKMLEIMELHEADILSANVPIRNKTGLTSTAIETKNPFKPKRLTMTELYKKYPKTFTDPGLLINTGCMLIDIRKPLTEALFFSFLDEIHRDMETGEFKAVGTPEDWNFSRLARAAGANIFCTTEVKVQHIGKSAFPNTHAWGTEAEDKI